MYTSFNVKNFRGFEDLEFNDLARVNLITGKNNVGKTALLEALFVYSGNYNVNLLLRRQTATNYQSRFSSSRDLGRRDQSFPDWAVLFHNFDKSLTIVLSANLSGIPQQLSFFDDETNQSLRIEVINANQLSDLHMRRLLTLTNRENFVPSSEIEFLSFNAKRPDSENTVYFQDRIISNIKSTPLFPATFLPSGGQMRLREDALKFTELKKMRGDGRLLTTLRVIEPRLDVLELLYDGDPPTPIIYGYIQGLNQPIPLTAMGDGIRRISSLILAIGTTQNGVVLVDEIENGLHHSILTDVWKAIDIAAREFNVQIFATTHSLEMIRAAHDAFKNNIPYGFRLHRLDRSYKTGEIYATTYNEEGMEAITNLNAEVRG